MTDSEDRDISLDRLAKFAAPDMEPTLTETELEDILDASIRGTRWVTVTALNYGDVIFPTERMGNIFKVVTAGTTGATEPTWDSTTITDGTVEMEVYGSDYESVYDVRAALRKAWELKAAKASELISSSDSGSEQMIFQQCQRMIMQYTTPVIA